MRSFAIEANAVFSKTENGVERKIFLDNQLLVNKTPWAGKMVRKILLSSGGKMRKFGLIGHPLGHSLSPQIHTRLFELSGETVEYKLYDDPG